MDPKTNNHQLFSEEEWRELEAELCLSPRQAQITRLLMRGFSDKQIARELAISVPTVRTHLHRLFLKLDLQDRYELALRVFMTFRESSEALAYHHA
jgi:DNA-binding NarL/FixJ family response regulator